MSKIINELNYMKFLLGYKRGVVLSEQITTNKTTINPEITAELNIQPCPTSYNENEYNAITDINGVEVQNYKTELQKYNFASFWWSKIPPGISGETYTIENNPSELNNLKNRIGKVVEPPLVIAGTNLYCKLDQTGTNVLFYVNNKWQIVQDLSTIAFKKFKTNGWVGDKLYTLTLFNLQEPKKLCLKTSETEKQDSEQNTVDITGNAKELIVDCSLNVSNSGIKADASKNYIGYEYNGNITVNPGNKLTIYLDSLYIPDAFYVKYGNQEFFSGFRGISRSLDKKTNYQKKLNNLTDLKSKIDDVINKLGGSLKVTDNDLIITQKGSWASTFTVQEKVPLKIIVFSPLVNTQFKITANCNNEITKK